VKWSHEQQEARQMSTTNYQESAANATPADWPGSPMSTMHLRTDQVQPLLMEQYPDKGGYVIRLEIPGVDPTRDLTVAVETGTLTVTAERRDDAPPGHETEFHYGSFARHVALPPDANVEDVSAASHDGILTVRIGMEPEHPHGPRAIDVTVEP
jgi:HSP20 family protein